MAEPHVPFALKLPVDLDRAIREEAQISNKSIQATIVSMLQAQVKLVLGIDTLEERS